jgi:hypothetical protein
MVWPTHLYFSRSLISSKASPTEYWDIYSKNVTLRDYVRIKRYSEKKSSWSCDHYFDLSIWGSVAAGKTDWGDYSKQLKLASRCKRLPQFQERLLWADRIPPQNELFPHPINSFSNSIYKYIKFSPSKAWLGWHDFQFYPSLNYQ